MTKTERQVAKASRERQQAIRATLRANRERRAIAVALEPVVIEGVVVVSRIRGYLPKSRTRMGESAGYAHTIS